MHFDYHQGTELAGVDQFLNLTVAAVVTAHEANLYQVLAAGHLGLNDLLAVSSGVCQRLLGEYRLASLDSCQNRTLVELTWVVTTTAFTSGSLIASLKSGVNLGAGTGNLSALLSAFFKYVADCNDLCVANAVLDTLNVFTADHAAADQCNVQVFHDEFLLKCCVKWVKRWFCGRGQRRLFCVYFRVY